MNTLRCLVFLSAAFLLAACGPGEAPAPPLTETAPQVETAPQADASPPADYGAAVDAQRLINANAEPGQWMSTGRTYDEQRFSPLDQINTDTVSGLGLAWYADLDTSRGQEATPIVVDGAIYITTAWSMVKAYDAASGELLWEYDPEVDRARAVDACCDVVNRGAAVWNGKVFVGAIDGRLIALDSRSGAEVWSVQTTDPQQPQTITGAPRVVNGQVVIGNGGAEYAGIRGYVTAYDAETGEQTWRFYTVPGNPADGFEQPELEWAALTWTGEWWELGGGGTVWDSMAYDSDLNLLYLGVGNGSPWNHSLRSPGGGDNLFLTAIVAINPDDGSYVWHYQTTPGETWDYTATQQMVLADLDIGGQTRRVIMQAPKNGFFYVLDAATGTLISAEKFVPANWASHVDLETGRPVENPMARYDLVGEPAVVWPGPQGGHNWHPMAFSPQTNLMYIPAREMPFGYYAQEELEISDRGWNTGTDFAQGARLMQEMGDEVPERTAYLLAWDPVTQREAWRVPHAFPTEAAGVVATAGGLVFQGNASGEFVAYHDRTGEPMWRGVTQAVTVAAPVTYAINGEQYVALVTGSRALPESGPGAVGRTTAASSNNSRLLVFRLGGQAELPTELPADFETAVRELDPPLSTASHEVIAQGEQLYGQLCSVCHGPAAISESGDTFPDLRYSALLHSLEDWDAVVLEGTLTSTGMVSFASSLQEGDSDAIREYVVARAHEAVDAP